MDRTETRGKIAGGPKCAGSRSQMNSHDHDNSHSRPLTESNVKKRKSFDFVTWALEKRDPPVTARLAQQERTTSVRSMHESQKHQSKDEEEVNNREMVEDLDRWMAVCDEVADLSKRFGDITVRTSGHNSH